MKVDEKLISWGKLSREDEVNAELKRKKVLSGLGFNPDMALSSTEALILVDTAAHLLFFKQASDTSDVDSIGLNQAYPTNIAKKLGLPSLSVDQYFGELEKLGLNRREVIVEARKRDKSFFSYQAKAKAKAEKLFVLLLDSPFVSQEELNELVDPASIYKFVELILGRAAEARARINVAVKNRALHEAKQFVVAEWRSHKVAYANNKSAFARDYVSIIANQFSDGKGHPVKITEKTIKEVWLRDPPPTSKPAG